MDSRLVALAAIRVDGKLVATASPAGVGGQAKVSPAPFALDCNDMFDRRAAEHRKRHALADVRGFAIPCNQQ